MAVELQGCAASSGPSAPRWIWVPAPTEGGEMMLEESLAATLTALTQMQINPL